ncbi:hypothetical protein ACIP96_06265 [Streptomyces nigra]|uniref:hypothetical protein n=1 Tax=Streptomyces nigra TaxID=1827580 RepID=UPI00381733D3
MAAPALRLVEPRAVVPGSERRLAIEHWLLATLPRERHRAARAEWSSCGVAMLPLGGLFAAVRIPGELVYAFTRTRDWRTVDPFLRETLAGPVICDPHNGGRYYALVPGGVPITWKEAAEDWRVSDVEVLGRDTVLGVPSVDAVDFNEEACASYWSSPMSSAGELCAPLHVARLIAACAHEITGSPEAAPRP